MDDGVQCRTGKKTYSTATAAVLACGIANKHFSDKLNAYRCGLCGWYHLGHRKPGDRGTVRFAKLRHREGRRGRLERRRRLEELEDAE